MENKKKKKFNLYDFFNGRDGKGVTHDPNAKKNLKYFFPLLYRKFNSIALTNVYLVFGNWPILFLLFANAGFLNTQSVAPTNALYPLLFGASTVNPNASPLSILFGIFGAQGAVSIPTVWTYVFYGIGALVILTFGIVNVGCAHLLRSMVREEPIFFRSDFAGAIKRNFRQALILGVLDLGIIFALLYGFLFYSMNAGTNFFMNCAYYFFWIIMIIYFFMRFYLYQMLVTFDLSFKKLFKNAFIFAFVGFKRNVLALLGIVVLVILNMLLINYMLPLGIVLPFIITIGLASFIATYAAYPKMKELMIDPVLAASESAQKTAELPSELSESIDQKE